MAEDKKTVILEFEVDVDQSVESINKLTAANKALRQERNAVNLNSKEGQKRVQELNAQIDNNTQKIKANVSAIEQQKINIGNYSSALDKVFPGLGGFAKNLGEATKNSEGFSGGLKAMTGGIWGAVKASLAFIATPIGAVLAAVGIALAAVTKYLTGSEEGMDKFAKISAQAGAILNVLLGTLREVGGALVDIFSGDFSKGIDRATEAFDGMTMKMAEAAIEAGKLADVFDQLEELQLRQQIRNDEEANQIKNLIIQSKNRKLTDQERFDLLDKAAKQEKKLTGENLAIKLADINATTKQILIDQDRLDLQQKIGETTVEFAKRIAKDEFLLLDQRKEIASKLGEYNTLLDNQANIQEKIANQQDALSQKQQEAQQKRLESLQKEQEEQAKLNAEVDAYLKKFQQTLEAPRKAEEAIKKDQDERSKLAADFLAQQGINTNKAIDLAKMETDRKRKFKEQENKFNKESARIKQEVDQASAEATSDLLGAIASGLDKDSQEFKLTASARALINTYLAANAALASGSEISPIVGIISAAAAVVAGLQNVARINGIEFAEGGVVLKGPSHKEGGIPIVAEGNEIIMTKGVYNNPKLRAQASALNVAGGGRHFADGGIVTRSISQPINQNFDILNIVRNMPAPVVGVKQFAKEWNSVKVKENASKR